MPPKTPSRAASANMVSKKEAKTIRKFVCAELRDEPDLSELTLGILKRRYLAHERCEKLTPEARNLMKRVVEEELMKMQDNDDSESELETNMEPSNKRKRENGSAEISGKEEEEEEDDDDDDDVESTAKKSRRQSNSSSVEKDDYKTESESEEEEQINSVSDNEEQGVDKKRRKTNANLKRQISSEDSTDEEINRSEDSEKNKSDVEEDPNKMVMKRTNATQNGENRSSNSSPAKKTPQSDEENETDMDSESEKRDNINDDSSDHSGKEEKMPVETKNDKLDSDSSSLPSLEDEPQGGKAKTQDDKKKRTLKKEPKNEKSQKDDNKAVVRLKRYISLCGVRLNYKKLLDGCRSVRSQVDVLKKELEDLGVNGQPSIVKCKKVRMKREESRELAELDVNNIIATKGRPKRRGSSAWQKQPSPPSSTYLRSLNSASDCDEENNAHRAQRRATDWANLQGIISDDADSN